MQTINVNVWVPKPSEEDPEYDRIISLHRANSATLGHLPYQAFKQAGEKGQIVVGSIDDEVKGYVLYTTPRQYAVKLVHVCVDTSARDTGLAKAMVDEVIARNPNRYTLTAHCRKDYNLDRFWQSIGMNAIGERPGRSAGGSILTIWEKRLSQYDLFESLLIGSNRPLAVLDTNVVMDLYMPEVEFRATREQSIGLREDWLVDLIDFSIPKHVLAEINNIQLDDLRNHIQARLQSWVPLRPVSNFETALRNCKNRMSAKFKSADSSLNKDAGILAEAVAGEADYLVTNDSNLIEACKGWTEDEYGLLVLRPYELMQKVFSKDLSVESGSEILDRIGLSLRRLDSDSPELEKTYIASDSAERPSSFRQKLREALAKPTSADVHELIDDEGHGWALLVRERIGSELKVSMLRVSKGRAERAISFQLIRYLRDSALEQGLDAVRVADTHLSNTLQEALEADGFLGNPATARISRYVPYSLEVDFGDSRAVASYERQNWPQVILGASTPVYIVPIQPMYASELLGHYDGLFAMVHNKDLGLSRELVYFAAPMIKSWDTPGRLLWYVTHDPNAPRKMAVRAVVAHSRLVSAEVLPVDVALERHRSRGTLRESQIRKRAMKGEILVLRFEDTQILPRPVSRALFNRILSEHGVTRDLQTMRRGKPAVFDSIMRSQPGWEGQQ